MSTNGWKLTLAAVLFTAGCAQCADEPVGAPPGGDADPPTEPGERFVGVELDTVPTLDLTPIAPPLLVLQFGADVPVAVRQRIELHLRTVATRQVVLTDAIEDLPAGSLVLGFGDVPATDAVLGVDRVAPGPEGFRIRSGVLGDATALVADGTSEPGDEGVKFAAYGLLEQLGFGFLHPLEPTLPETLPTRAPDVDIETAPRWWFRGIQLHTMHPLELTDLLNGWGPGGPQDAAGWHAMLGEWDTFLEWMLANGQNQVHWYLLSGEPWADFPGSPKHIERLRTIVSRAHDFGVLAGADVPIRQHQQNSWRMIADDAPLDEELQQIRDRVDLLMEADFDFIASASGTTEFTAPDDHRMLAWMNALTEQTELHGKRAYLKVHASSGQTTANYTDRETGEPLNFNFLPTYADPRLGIMPHTVQHYALDDPAPTYGNQDFGYIREFLQEEVGRRPTIWHPETSYWVSFDVDVPLFLPVYALTRTRDLRLLAEDEIVGAMGRDEHAGKKMDGQSTFSSGWEWGYWIGEVVTARAAWEPRANEPTDAAALRAHLQPLSRVLGDAGPAVVDLVIELAEAQHALLVRGAVGGVPPAEIDERNGQAYLQGSETWDDVADLATRLGVVDDMRTQPAQMPLHTLRSSATRDTYAANVAPLLADMKSRFGNLHRRLEAQRPNVARPALPLFDDIVDAAHITALRARQVHGLYEYAFLVGRGDASAATSLQDAQSALDEAMLIVQRRERAYRVPADRISSWRENPTAYDFGYLWTVRTLHYWWRDEAKAVAESRLNPCYLNVIDPLAVAFGEGSWSQLGDVAADVLRLLSLTGGDTVDCLSVPAEPTYPPPGLR